MYSSILATLAQYKDKKTDFGPFVKPVLDAKGEVWLWMRGGTNDLLWTRHKLHYDPHPSKLVFAAEGADKDRDHPYQEIKGQCCLFMSGLFYFIETDDTIGPSYATWPKKSLMWFDKDPDTRIQFNLNVGMVSNF